MYKNLSSKRLIHFAGIIYTIEARAFQRREHELFQKCYRLNDVIYSELRKRSFK